MHFLQLGLKASCYFLCVAPTLRELKKGTHKHTREHTAPSADRHGAQADNSSELQSFPEESDGKLMSR